MSGFARWVSRTTSVHLGREPATNSNPLIPAAIVMIDSEPSGLWREATSLLHSPKSNTVRGSDVPQVDLAERLVRVTLGERRSIARIGRHDEQPAGRNGITE